MLVMFSSYNMNTNEVRMFHKPSAIGTGQVPVRAQRQIIKLQNNDRLNDVSADRNIEQNYGNLLVTFNAIKTFTKKLHGCTYACKQAFSFLKFRKIKFVSGLNDLHAHSKLCISSSRFQADIYKFVPRTHNLRNLTTQSKERV